MLFNSLLLNWLRILSLQKLLPIRIDFLLLLALSSLMWMVVEMVVMKIFVLGGLLETVMVTGVLVLLPILVPAWYWRLNYGVCFMASRLLEKLVPMPLKWRVTLNAWWI
jgi:hypothetical protein